MVCIVAAVNCGSIAMMMEMVVITETAAKKGCFNNPTLMIYKRPKENVIWVL